MKEADRNRAAGKRRVGKRSRVIGNNVEGSRCKSN